MQFAQIKSLGERIKENVSKVIVGRDDTIELMLVALFCSGHVLLEDVPGVGKTVMAKSLAKSVDCGFKRIQFTPDLLPSDLTGINYYNMKSNEFIFRAGPVFTNIILADEINRATPRTQSSLLECMEERQVTVDGETKELSRPFFVIATQNPIETQGTFPLPEAQLDRFFLRLKVGYPDSSDARRILDRFKDENPLQKLSSVTDAAELTDAQDSCSNVSINDAVKDYVINIVEATRKHDRVMLGVSPRGSPALMRASQAYAVLKGRQFVTPDDVKHVAIPVLAHRMIIRGHAISSGTSSSEAIITDILNKVPTPVEPIDG